MKKDKNGAKKSDIYLIGYVDGFKAYDREANKEVYDGTTNRDHESKKSDKKRGV